MSEKIKRISHNKGRYKTTATRTKTSGKWEMSLDKFVASFGKLPVFEKASLKREGKYQKRRYDMSETNILAGTKAGCRPQIRKSDI